MRVGGFQHGCVFCCLSPGERVELAGNTFKDRDGKLNMDVQTLVMDYGPCTP